MAEEAAQGLAAEANTASDQQATESMELETAADPQDGAAGSGGPSGAANGNSDGKRAREKGDGRDEEDDDGPSKKLKAEKSVEEEWLEKEELGRVKLGGKEFGSSTEMLDYFFNFLRFWPPNITINKYEHMMLLDLIKKGHSEPDKKIGAGVKAFQVRYHPLFKSRCFFLVREDESVDDFSFRKCVDHINPLPEDMKPKRDGGNHHRGRGRGGHGRRGGKR